MTKYGPYYLLHGREMALPSSHHLSAKLPPEIQGTENASRLKSLKASLELAYKVARENIRKAYHKNKGYYDRKSKHREIEAGNSLFV
jgi:hypothetical protein